MPSPISLPVFVFQVLALGNGLRGGECDGVEGLGRQRVSLPAACEDLLGAAHLYGFVLQFIDAHMGSVAYM